MARAKKEDILGAGFSLFLASVKPKILAKIGVKPKTDLSLPSVADSEHPTNPPSELKEPEKYNTLDSADETVLKERLRLYEGNKGLFLIFILGIGRSSLARLSPDSASLTEAQEARLRATLAESLRPGFAERYQLRLEKLRANAADLELVSLPTFLSRHNPPEPGKKYDTVVSGFNHPWSCGTIAPALACYHATSPDTPVPLALDPHYYEDKFDLKNMVEPADIARQLGKTLPLGDIIAREHNPGLEVQTDREIVARIKQLTNSVTSSVVYMRLKVYGTSNIRVVDLSELPLHIGAPTEASVYALAERADLILMRCMAIVIVKGVI
ncbi:hypothetical protein EI94DRAFT_1703685 [Lactarius quietus]|nr:hypothetical protein EI94DRAFT_1703685 [Lactarius quietus]